MLLTFVPGFFDQPRIASQILRLGRTLSFTIACSTRSICT
jgi:hypothetical protein